MSVNQVFAWVASAAAVVVVLVGLYLSHSAALGWLLLTDAEAGEQRGDPSRLVAQSVRPHSWWVGNAAQQAWCRRITGNHPLSAR